MTRQTVQELYDDAQRLRDDVRESMQSFEESHPDVNWGVEYEIPAETNGWVYYGDMGAPAGSANWGDRWPDPRQAVGVIVEPTHPQDKVPTVAKAHHVEDMDDKIDSRTEIDRFVGEEYRTPLYVRRRIFWQAVEAAIQWMEEHPAE